MLHSYDCLITDGERRGRRRRALRLQSSVVLRSVAQLVQDVTGACVLQDETGRLMRRNIVRYMILAYVITLQRVSLRVKRRFPTWQHVVDSGQYHVTTYLHNTKRLQYLFGYNP